MVHSSSARMLKGRIERRAPRPKILTGAFFPSLPSLRLARFSPRREHREQKPDQHSANKTKHAHRNFVGHHFPPCGLRRCSSVAVKRHAAVLAAPFRVTILLACVPMNKRNVSRANSRLAISSSSGVTAPCVDRRAKRAARSWCKMAHCVNRSTGSLVFMAQSSFACRFLIASMSVMAMPKSAQCST